VNNPQALRKGGTMYIMEEHSNTHVTTHNAVAKRDLTPFYIPASIVIAGIIIGASLIVAFGGGGSSAAQGARPVVDVNVEDIDISNAPYVGEKNAPVTLVAWADYQCPFCKAVEVGHPQIPTKPAYPILMDEYVKTGKLRIVFKDFAFLSEDSTTAALYGRAVWDLYPQAYYEWRDAMFLAQDEEHGGFGNEETILQLSRTIAGIDASALKAAVAKNKDAYTKIIEADRNEAAKFGITGTPGFVTGEVLLPGAVGPEEFKAAIEAQL
jgi:protein-disulfide isomerase